MVSECHGDHVTESHTLGIGSVADDIADGLGNSDVEIITRAQGLASRCSLGSRHEVTVPRVFQGMADLARRVALESIRAHTGGESAAPSTQLLSELGSLSRPKDGGH